MCIKRECLFIFLDGVTYGGVGNGDLIFDHVGVLHHVPVQDRESLRHLLLGLGHQICSVLDETSCDFRVRNV